MNLDQLRALWDAHAKAVYAYLRRLTKNEAEAADFLQDLFCRLARQPELVEKLSGSDARGYLLRLAHNSVVDQVRRSQARERIFGKIATARAGDFAEDASPDEALLRRELLAALEDLPEDQRVIVHGRLWKMRTLDDLARELGISINTAASRYRYGLDKMRTRLRSLYEDFASSPKSKPSMKTPTPFTPPAEEPIIRPLEQRRVPSATGAAFALPVLPEAPEDVPAEEIPSDFEETAVDPELGDPIIFVDPLPGEEGELPGGVEGELPFGWGEIPDAELPAGWGEIPEGELPAGFEEVIRMLEGSEGVEGVPLPDGGIVEEFNPDVIFYTLFTREGEVGGEEIIELEGEKVVEGEGEILIDDIIEEVPVDKDGDGIKDSPEVIEEEILEITPDMVKRGDDGGESEPAEGEYNPDVIFYTMADGVPTAEAAPNATADHAPAATPQAPAPLAAVPEAAAAQPGSIEFAFRAETTTPEVLLPHAGSPTVIPFTELSAPIAPETDVLVANLEVASLDVHTLVFSNAASDALPAGFEATHGDLAVDEWVPAQSDLAAAELVTHLDTVGMPAEHAALIAPVDAGAAATGHETLRGSSVAMAATGAMLLVRDGKTRDAKAREQDEQA